MNIDLSEEALEYGGLVKKALESAGGDELAQAIEREPEQRQRLVAPLLAELGAWELDPRSRVEELEAAAALCQSAGYWAVPYPVAARLCRPRDQSADGLVVVGDANPEAAIAGLDLRWLAVTMDGRRRQVMAPRLTASPRTAAFVCPLELVTVDGDGSEDLALALALPCWTLLGMLDRAMDVTSTYVVDRQQFGQPLAAFQGVQFQLTDAEVERAGAEQLGKYALWSIQSGSAESVDDALAFRLATVEAAAIVFRVAHQLHGAIGFCDETTLSWVSRYSLPLRRLPFGPAVTLDHLSRRLGRRGLAGPFRGEYGG
jgi:hypothetical protein